MLFRISFLWGTVLVVMLFGMPGPAASFEGINKSFIGDLALGGYDAVSYFDEGRAIKGDKRISAEWKGAVWWFSNALNRERFLATPDIFAPQYGGYCSNQMSLGNLSDIDPDVWMIVDDKLYLFGHENGRKRWSTGTHEKINDADAHWQRRMKDANGNL